MSIVPAFDRRKREATLIGRILVAAGELEVTLAALVGMAVFENADRGLHVVYTVKSASGRIDLARTLLRPRMEELGLSEDYLLALSAVKHSWRIRNQYAHCQWADGPGHRGLFFVDLEEAADRRRRHDTMYRHVGSVLLEQQLAYFEYALALLRFSTNELVKKINPEKSLTLPKPTALPLPPLCNPPTKHVPPWLSEEDRTQHLKHAQASEMGNRPRTLRQKESKPSRRAGRKAAMKENGNGKL